MKIKLIKLREADDPVVPNNIPEGDVQVREMPDEWFRKPAVGEPFYAGNRRTSVVQEIIDDQTFRTHNSVYKWEIVKEERFSVEEIKKYILSQDSLGDVMYNLNAENIRKANQSEEQQDDI